METRTLLLYMPDGGQQGVLRAWFSREQSWVEFRGRPHTEWDSEAQDPFQAAHDALEGWHSTVLHQDEVLALFPKHPDYHRIAEMMEQA